MKNSVFVPFQKMHFSLSVIDFFCNSDQKMTRQRLTPQEKAFIVTEFGKTQCTLQVQMAFFNAYERKLHERTPRRLYNLFRETGSVKEKARSGRPRSARTEENIAKVRQSIEAEPRLSTRRRCQRLGMSRASMLLIMNELDARCWRFHTTQHVTNGRCSCVNNVLIESLQTTVRNVCYSPTGS